jgi:hypothetical protein
MLNQLVEENGIAPHTPVFDKSKREDGTFSCSDFRYNPTGDVYHCPGGKRLGTSGTVHKGKTLPSSTAMYARSNRSAVQKIHHTRSRATSMNTPETLPGRLLTRL